MSSFLIVKTSALGDIIQSFPVLEYLHHLDPLARVDWVVEKGAKPLVASHPLVDNVYCVDTRKWRRTLGKVETIKEIHHFRLKVAGHQYDAAFDLQGNTKSALVMSMVKAKEKVGFGFSSAPEKLNVLVTNKRFNPHPSLNIRSRYLNLLSTYFNDKSTFIPQGVLLNTTAEEKKRIDEILSSPELCSKPIYMVSFGSKWPNKRLEVNTLRKFLELIDAKFQPSFLFIWGDEEEKMVAEGLQRCFAEKSVAIGDLTLPLWQALMSNMQLVIATDSAGLHLAGLAGVATFSFFGPSSAAIYQPLGEQHHSFQGKCPYGIAFNKRCPKLRTCSTGGCIRFVSPEELFDSFAGQVNSEAVFKR